MKKISFLVLIAFSGLSITAQNVSYDVNSIPISGNWNTAVGGASLNNTGTGVGNTAVGRSTLSNNTFGGNNVAIGIWSLNSNQTGSNNVAIGSNALNANISGQSNLAIGADAMMACTTGDANTAIGNGALYGNGTGHSNLGIGTHALYYNNTGSWNTAIGDFSGVPFGSGALLNSTAIGYGATVNASNTMQLGNQFVTKVFAGTSTNAILIAGGLQITGGILGAGKVLTSDANGVATWQVPTGGGGGFFTNAPIGLGNIINTNSGGVIIGTGITSAPTPGYKLYVSDGILTEKVKVALKNSIDWPDYVFEKKYTLMPLLEVEAYVNKNKHLPGIQSADQLIKEGGIDISQMLSKQMQKIEELTLYLIQLKKENDEIKAKLTALENKK